MPRPIAICLEDLDATTEDGRYVQCTVIAGADPGLSLDAAGVPRWRHERPACELFVSLDERLALYRLEGAPAVMVRRGARSVDAPVGQPVILLDQDEVELSGRRLRVHVHGEAPQVSPPVPLLRQVAAAAGRVATAAVLGGAALLGCNDLPDWVKPLEVRAQPPKIAIPHPPPTPADVPAAVPDVPDAVDAPDVPDVPKAVQPDKVQPPPIEVRPTPPAVAVPKPPPEPPAPPAKK